MSDNGPIDTAPPPPTTELAQQAEQSPPPTADVPKDKVAQDAGASAIPDTTDTKTEPGHTSTDMKLASPKTGDDDAALGQGDQVIDITSDDGVNTAGAKDDPTPATGEDKAKELEPEPSKLDASHPTQPDTSTSSAPAEESSSTHPPKDEIKALPPTVFSPATSSDAASLPEVSPSMVEGSATPKPKAPAAFSPEPVEATPAPSKTSTEPGPTPAPAPVSQPGAPAKPPPGAPPEETQPTPARVEGLAAFQTPGASTRISPDLAEFDPFATPAPSKAPPKLPQRPQIRTDAVRSAPQAAPQAQAAAGPSRSQRPSRQNSRPGSGQRSAQGSAQGSRSGTPNPRRQNSEDNEPAFNFAGFLRDLKVKSAEPVARYLKRYAV